MPSSTARVVTDRADHHLKNLASHFKHGNQAVLGDHHAEIHFPYGTLLLDAEGFVLTMHARAADSASLKRTEDNSQNFLERHSPSERPIIDWVRDPD